MVGLLTWHDSADFDSTRGLNLGRVEKKSSTLRKPSNSLIGAWLSEEDGRAFGSYAHEFGLDESALATLLVVRELRIGRLKSIAHTRAEKSDKSKRVTARPRQPEIGTAFANHALLHGLRSGQAAALLIRMELSEQWLRSALSWIGNQLDSRPD